MKKKDLLHQVDWFHHFTELLAGQLSQTPPWPVVKIVFQILLVSEADIDEKLDIGNNFLGLLNEMVKVLVVVIFLQVLLGEVKYKQQTQI